MLNFNEDGSKTRRRGRPIGSVNKTTKDKPKEKKVKRPRGRPRKVKSEEKPLEQIKKESPNISDSNEFRSLLDTDELDFDLDS